MWMGYGFFATQNPRHPGAALGRSAGKKAPFIGWESHGKVHEKYGDGCWIMLDNVG
jgi:hypothetical protein